MFTVYILQSLKSQKFYIGHTNDLTRRLNEHNAGKSSFAKAHRPFKVVYIQRFSSKQLAYQREIEIKSYKGGNEFQKLIIRTSSSPSNTEIS